MILKLPFNLNAEIQTECWTFYKVAIISAYPQLKPWLLQHCNNLFLTGNFQLTYGENCRIYDQYRYFEQVLTVKEADYTLLDTKERAICYISDMLNRQDYILLECDFTGIDIEGNWDSVRECLIYGIDTQKQTVYVPHLEKGKWVSVEVKISLILRAFQQSQSNINCLYDTLRLLQYRATLFHPIFTGQFCPSLQVFWKDIRYIYKSNTKEMHLLIKKKNSRNDLDQIDVQTYWDGYNACLAGLMIMIQKLLYHKWEEQSIDQNFALTFKRLWEYRVYFGIRNRNLEEYFVPEYVSKHLLDEQYEILLLRNASLFALKYIYYHNEKSLKVILKILQEVKEIDDHLLEDLYVCLSEKINY